MDNYLEALSLVNKEFGRDIQYSLATCLDDKPFVRIIDGYFKDGIIYLTSYSLSSKAKQIALNSNVSLCYRLNIFHGNCQNIGNPTLESNQEIREELKKAFYLFYEKHVDEKDTNTCLLKIELTMATMFINNKKYQFDFVNKKVKVSDFIDDMIYLS